MTREQLMQYLIEPIRLAWQLSYADMPGDETFYRAFHKEQPGEAFCEKLAIYYYAKKDKLNVAEMQRLPPHRLAPAHERAALLGALQARIRSEGETTQACSV